MERVILHCDMNNFFASVECMLNPELKDKAVAVCGSTEERHGIVLAKNYIAKSYGVATAEPVWQALTKCPELTIVSPHMELYVKYSKLAREIYSDYTDQVEAFGLDECWLDVTGSGRLFGSGYDIALLIKERIKRELGLTISIGVSFNKVFAKLGSDMKKPDAITCIYKEDFKEKIWDLPVESLIGVGASTQSKLNKYMITTIGELAAFPADVLTRTLGKAGIMLWRFANGMDTSAVTKNEYKREPESVGRGATLPHDLSEDEQIWKVAYGLSQDVSRRLRKDKLFAGAIQIQIRDNTLADKGWQSKLSSPSSNALVIAKAAFALFKENYTWHNDVRAVTVRAINLEKENSPQQLNLIFDYEKVCKLESMDTAIDKINTRYGIDCVKPALYVKKAVAGA